jgi:hypothetical protein
MVAASCGAQIFNTQHPTSTVMYSRINIGSRVAQDKENIPVAGPNLSAHPVGTREELQKV